MAEPAVRAEVLRALGATQAETEELLVYNANAFDQARDPPKHADPHVAVWREYAAEAREIGTIAALEKRLVQLHFPIAEGISETDGYRAATRRGDLSGAPGAGKKPSFSGRIDLEVYDSIAGPIPIITAAERVDFETLVRALAMKNEPQPVPPSMGACMVKGLNNWDRVRRDGRPISLLKSDPSSHQDRLILLSRGPYSGVSAADMGLSVADWLEKSLLIRRAHECAHYFTLRLFGSMQNNLRDELLADYAGIVSAEGRYRADWFLRFVGLESGPGALRQGGRLELYRGKPPLSDGAFVVLQGLITQAARNLERWDLPLEPALRAICRYTLEEIASTKVT